MYQDGTLHNDVEMEFTGDGTLHNDVVVEFTGTELYKMMWMWNLQGQNIT